MNLNTCTDRELLLLMAKRLVCCRISPDEGAQFLREQMTRAALRQFHGHQLRAASWLGVSRQTMSRWITEFKIDAREFRPVGRRRKGPVSVLAACQPRAAQEMTA